MQYTALSAIAPLVALLRCRDRHRRLRGLDCCANRVSQGRSINVCNPILDDYLSACDQLSINVYTGTRCGGSWLSHLPEGLRNTSNSEQEDPWGNPTMCHIPPRATIMQETNQTRGSFTFLTLVIISLTSESDKVGSAGGETRFPFRSGCKTEILPDSVRRFVPGHSPAQLPMKHGGHSPHRKRSKPQDVCAWWAPSVASGYGSRLIK